MSSPIRFHEVHRRFGTNEVLRGLSFEVRHGEIYALLGRNGAGKTTAMRVLLGFLAPMHGRAEILGVDSRALEPALRERIGLVSEGHALYRWMRVEDVLSFEAGTRSRFDLARARALCERLALSRRAQVAQLSRGQLAQLSLLAATCGNPEVLVLDDPAMGLDPVVRRDLLSVLIDLIADTGASVLLSTHILSDVERIADRVGILHRGSLIVDATMDDLRRRVEVRFVRGGDAARLEREVPRCLRARPRANGHELYLVDIAEDTRRALESANATEPAGAAPSLEELFVELTRDNRDLAREVQEAGR